LVQKTSLLELLEDVGTKTFHYSYDFGDNWSHVIKVEKIDDAIPEAEYPASSEQSAPVRKKTAAVLSATQTSSKPSPIQTMKAMPK
jgi:hypothetical protein